MTQTIGFTVAIGTIAIALVAYMPASKAGAQTGPQAGTQIACGSIYEARPGDGLTRIATAAYGSGDYQALFKANRDFLPDSGDLDIGDQLLIPCLDGTGPQTRAEALAAPATAAPAIPTASAAAVIPTASAAAVIPDAPGIGLLTGSDFAPFAHSALPEGGMAAELVALSLITAAPGSEPKLTFVDDWSRHLLLLDSGEFDLGFPWYKPDCSRAERLAEPMRRRCAGFIFSEPLFAVSIGFYVKQDSPFASASDPTALYGAHLCRPAGYFTFDLDQEDLRAPNVTLVVPATAADCFARLARGEVDVVSLSTGAAEIEISRLGLLGLVVPIPTLASSQTLHAVTPADNPEGRAYLEMVNTGLTELKASGRWFEVVSRHLGAFGMSMR